MASQANGANGDNPMFSSGGQTMCILGCGTLGIAILSGILDTLSSPSPSSAYPPASTPTTTIPPPIHPGRFIACVRRPESVKRVTKALPQNASYPVNVVQDSNVSAVSSSQIVLLGCKPQMVAEILSAPGMREALAGKLLISILAGVTVDQIESILYDSTSNSLEEITSQNRCRIVRVMPNTAAIVRESMTVIATSDPPLSPDQNAIVTWIFSSIGRIVHLPPSTMDVSTALCGSGPAFLALMLESLADGAVAMGLPRQEAQLMAAQTMRGTAGMVLNGEHPALVREKVSTPGGCTIGGLLVLEEGRVRGTVARSVREASVVAGMLGTGAKGVNGTRF